MKDPTDYREALISAAGGTRITLRFKDRAALRRWQTGFNSARRREEGRIVKAWMEDLERGLTPPAPAIPWERVRTWTTGPGGLTLVVGVPTPEDLGIITEDKP